MTQSLSVYDRIQKLRSISNSIKLLLTDFRHNSRSEAAKYYHEQSRPFQPAHSESCQTQYSTPLSPPLPLLLPQPLPSLTLHNKQIQKKNVFATGDLCNIVSLLRNRNIDVLWREKQIPASRLESLPVNTFTCYFEHSLTCVLFYIPTANLYLLTKSPLRFTAHCYHIYIAEDWLLSGTFTLKPAIAPNLCASL